MLDASSGRNAAIKNVLGAALALTLINALKPLTMDDPSYYWHAQQTARAPLDPYGGEMFFQEQYGPAVLNVAPPVLIYWLALGIRVVGDHPGLLKVWLLPFAILLGATVHLLLRRFARGMEGAGVWLVLLSPAILPSLNLMLDVPALALGLAATALFLRAADRESLGLAVGAGVVAGLTMQTKYTGFTVAGVMLAIGGLRGRWRLAVVACAVAAAVFVGWEAWVASRYGVSQLLHFFDRRARGETGPANILDLIRPLVRTLGPLASALVPLGLVGLGARRRVVFASIALVLAVHVAYALTPDAALRAIAGLTGGRLVNLYNLTLGLLGPALVLVGAATLCRLAVRRRGARASARAAGSPRWRGSPDLHVLLVWLAIEILAYLTISTFPAARRTLGVWVVLTLIVCRLASRAIRRAPERRRWVPAVVALGVALGVLYFVADLDDAWAERRTVRRVEERVAAGGGGRIWYLGSNWSGFEFYAPRAGFAPVIPGRSWLARGDWLVIPWSVQVKHGLRLADSSLQRVVTLGWDGRAPVTTREAFYRGTRPLRRPERDWEAATLYRVVGSGRLVRPGPLPAR